MKKKQIAGILAPLLLLTAAAGCGKQADAGGEPDLPPPAGTEIVSDEKVPKAETPGETGGAAFALTEEELLALPEDPADAYSYNEVDGNLRILNRNGDSEIFVIPSMIDGKEVSQIAGRAFAMEDMKAVVIPETVTRIGKEAFLGCTELETVYVKGEALIEIGEKAFMICNSLSNIYLPDSITMIEPTAFSGCEELKKIDVPDNLSVLRGSTFFSTGLEEIELPSEMTEIEGASLANCPALKYCAIPDSVKIIGVEAFTNSPNVIIVASPDSYAAQFAAEKGIKFQEA
ncbi:MAG: leucine-rich repeat domain-containing protein [Oscillospiraceae bacterium]|jgi:hypothetical protein|nr:leucine-rich repeat domain-containing protein [Oscillospiraceae bacterium]